MLDVLGEQLHVWPKWLGDMGTKGKTDIQQFNRSIQYHNEHLLWKGWILRDVSSTRRETDHHWSLDVHLSAALRVCEGVQGCAD